MTNAEYTSHRVLLADRISSLRKKQRLSGRKFALMVGISRTYLRKLEAAEASPTFDMMERIAAGLNVTVVELVTFGSEIIDSEYRG